MVEGEVMLEARIARAVPTIVGCRTERGEVRRDGGESEAAIELLTQLKSKKPDKAGKISQQKKKKLTERVNSV